MRQTIVEVKGKGVVQIIDWQQELLRRSGVDRQAKSRLEDAVQPDLHQSGIMPIRVIPRIGRRILDKEEPTVRTWKDVDPRPKRQWQKHLHQRKYVEKRSIYPSPKLIDWKLHEEIIENEAQLREELLNAFTEPDSRLQSRTARAT